VALQEAELLVTQRGQKSKIDCLLDTSLLAAHDAFLRQPVSMDSVAWWAQVGKEAEGGLNKLLLALDIACKDPIFNAAFRSRFSSILVQPDPSSSVRDALAPLTWTLLENKDLYQMVFRYNLNDGTQVCDVCLVFVYFHVNWLFQGWTSSGSEACHFHRRAAGAGN
jgi:hypothetical protein